MSKILTNNTASPVNISDTGITIPASGQYLIDPGEYPLFSRSDDVVPLIGDLTLTVNNGTDDLGVSDGIRLIQDNFPTTMSILGATDPKITILTLTNSGVEYSHAFTDTTQVVQIRARNKSELKYSFTSGQSGTNFFTIPACCTESMDGISFLGKTIYIQSPTDGEIVEIKELFQ